MDYDYFSNHYKLIVIDLSKQIELENPDLKQKINFIGKLQESDWVTVFFIIVKSEEAKDKYNQSNPIKFDTASIKSSICDYCDAFILHDYFFCVIELTADNDTDIVFKNCASFSICKTEIDDVFTDKGNHIYIAMPLYNYIEYSDNYSDTSRNLW